MQINFQKKWHWVAGGAFALLFLSLLSFRLGLFSENTSAGRKINRSIAALPEREAWFSISQEGSKIGYAHRRFLPTKAGYHVTETVFLRINTMGVVQALRFRTEGELDSRMVLKSFNFDLNSGLFRFDARGEVRDGLLILYAGLPGENRKMEIDLPEPLHLSAGIFEISRFAGLKPGESRTLHVFDPVSMGERPVTVTLSRGEETLLHRGKKRRARKVSVNFMGAEQFAWLGEDGAVLKEKGILGITLEEAPRQEALEGIDQGGSGDLTDIASIPANKTINDPETIVELRVKLNNLGKGGYFLNGDRQALQKNVLTIRKETLPVMMRGGENGEVSPSSNPSPLSQCEHP